MSGDNEVLFKILDNRQTTFFNTNLSSNDIKTIYNKALADRIFKGGASKHIFKFPEGYRKQEILMENKQLKI